MNIQLRPTDGHAWMADALCVAVRGFTELDPLIAAEVCIDCPVRAECLEFGLDQVAPRRGGAKEVAAVYGGLTPLMLEAEARRRGVTSRATRERLALISRVESMIEAGQADQCLELLGRYPGEIRSCLRSWGRTDLADQIPTMKRGPRGSR